MAMRPKASQMFNSRDLAKFIILIGILLSFKPCYADGNVQIQSVCYMTDNCTFSDITSRDNLVSLWNSLDRMQPVHKGFYNTTIGNGSNTIYGVVQCRGDIPPAACSECKKNAIEDVKNGCKDTKCMVVWYTWCTLHYSSVNFPFYKMNYVATIKNSSILDDQDVALKGYNFMRGLASSTSGQPFMYQYEALDLGQSGKRYGMAQCNNDLNSSACSQCLNDELLFWTTRIEDHREWEIYSVLCSLWYRDYPFSYNVSRLSPPPPNASIGMRRVPIYENAACALIILVFSLLFAL